MNDAVGWLLVVLLVLLLLLVVAGVTALITWSVHRPSSAPPTMPGIRSPLEAQSPALQMLDERFAFGDIDEDDYIRRRAVLRGW